MDEDVEVAFSKVEAEFLLKSYDRLVGGNIIKYNLDVVSELANLVGGESKVARIPYDLCIEFMDYFDATYCWKSTNADNRLACCCWLRIMFKDLKCDNPYSIYAKFYYCKTKKENETSGHCMCRIAGIEMRYARRAWRGRSGW